MFKYGKRAGTIGIIAMCLALVPLSMVLGMWPTLGDQVAMNVSAGEVVRWGAKWELLIVPALGFMLVSATCASGLRQAKKYSDDTTMAQLTCSRFMRNALVESIVFIVVTGVMLYSAVTGMGFGA